MICFRDEVSQHDYFSAAYFGKKGKCCVRSLHLGGFPIKMASILFLSRLIESYSIMKSYSDIVGRYISRMEVTQWPAVLFKPFSTIAFLLSPKAIPIV